MYKHPNQCNREDQRRISRLSYYESINRLEVRKVNKLETYQFYADKCAAKLGIADKVVIKWAGNNKGIMACRLARRVYAHCHIVDSWNLRGTICISRSYFAKFSTKQWHHTIAHEVAHLAVKSAHHTPTFDRRLVTLGVANDSERLNARSARKGHHHVWMSGWDRQGRFSECRICHKRRI